MPEPLEDRLGDCVDRLCSLRIADSLLVAVGHRAADCRGRAVGGVAFPVAVNMKPEPPHEYATVRLGEYTVPLIGIPKEATQEKCSRCGSPLHLADTVLDAKGHPCCKSCLAEPE